MTEPMRCWSLSWLFAGFLLVAEAGATTEVHGDQTKVGNWFFQKRKDPMTDEKVFTAMTFGRTEEGESRTSEQLLIQCKGAKGVVLVLKLPEFATTNTRAFSFRVDEQKPYTHAWRVNRNRPGEYIVSDMKDLVRLTDPMFKGKLLRIRAEGGRVTYSFSLAGFPDSMANIDHCTK